ncbi:MAG: biotin/lipoyl-containing protein [bacterium]
MRFKVRIDDAELQIVAGADGRITVGVDGFEANVSRPGEDRRLVQVGDKSYEVRVIDNNAETGTYLLEVGGERVPVTVTDVSRGGVTPARAAGTTRPTVTGGRAAAGAQARAQAGAQAPARPSPAMGEGIRAPMPGRIVDVLVEVGDPVEAGDVLLILEAMKMENELRAPKKGTVVSVLVKKGDPAESGQLLVALE